MPSSPLPHPIAPYPPLHPASSPPLLFLLSPPLPSLSGEQPPPEVVAEEGRSGVHGAVTSDVESVMAVAGSRELSEMEERIKGKMERGSAKVVEYWEAVMKRLKVYKAKVGERACG